MEAVQVSIVVPALNEAENLPVLVPRVHEALGGRPYELIVVDDNSRDNTRVVCAELALKYPVKLIVREHPTAGLGGAVVEGMKVAQGIFLVVMDADLQHPPDKLPELIVPLERGEAEFVLGSRYVPGGGTEGAWGIGRQLNSWVATFLARPFAGKTRDPMSGFFALKRSTYDRATRLTPLGYKIGLEIMCKARVGRIKEIPIRFGLRTRGESKLSLKQQFKYLEHLSRLYDFTFPRLAPIAKFGIVIGLGWGLGFAFYLALIALGVGWGRACIAGYVINLAVTAIFHLRYVRTQRQFIVRQSPWVDFFLISAAELLACALTALWVTRRLTMPRPWEVFVIGFACATLVRYVLRKEMLLDIRGLRKELRREELQG